MTPETCHWPMRFCPVTRQTTHRCAISWPRSSVNTARPDARLADGPRHSHTEEVLAEMRQANPPVQYLEWARPRSAYRPTGEGLTGQALAGSNAWGAGQGVAPGRCALCLRGKCRQRRQERGMRKRQLKWLWVRLRTAPDVGRPDACRWRPEPAHKRRWVKIWHEIYRNATSAEGLNGRPPVKADSRRRRWPQASLYSGFYRSGTMGTGVGAQAA